MPKKMVIPSDLQASRKVELCLLDEVTRHGFSEAAAFAIRLALEEGINNAIKHGNGHDPDKNVEIGYDVNAERAAITITDQGKGFDPALVPDPTSDENIEKPCGRGIMLMRAFMDEVSFSKRGNQVYLIKRNDRGV